MDDRMTAASEDPGVQWAMTPLPSIVHHSHLKSGRELCCRFEMAI